MKMFTMNKIVKELIEIREKINKLKELEENLKKELLKNLGNINSTTIEEDGNRISVFKVKRIRVKNLEELPEKFKKRVEFSRPDVKKIKAHIDELKNQVEEVEDIQIRISSRDE